MHATTRNMGRQTCISVKRERQRVNLGRESSTCYPSGGGGVMYDPVLTHGCVDFSYIGTIYILNYFTFWSKYILYFGSSCTILIYRCTHFV